MLIQKPLIVSALLTLTLSSLYAQNLQPAGDVASAPPDEKFAVNTEAWDSFISFNGARIMGDPADHMFVPSASYYTSYTSVGKRLSKSTIVPSFSTSGPLFGGDGYLTLSGVLPFDGDDTYQFNTLGGWKYRLLEYLDIDVGGGLALYDQNSFGAGQPSQLGSYYRSAFFFGIIGRLPLNPAAYVTYDSQLEQVQAIVGVSETWKLAEEWTLFAEARLGQLSSQSYLGDSKSPVSGKWRNGYTYWLTTAEISWTPIKNGTIAAGIGYTGNNDGTRGIENIDLGPENTVYGKFSIAYSF
ncbi:hypothetical protein [Cerasicoccus arenae]|uniref:Uncharacterized protein n=1 Tax=Cerasicoccus arenae TaxID=424488 RepID=A0A8J3DGY0_9BACT|nr:hypothetical protein [Cerasicoccus arenae]MBK1858896.1 hypothetical protein [Cerasicoccus arenae]GHC05914.1 hypothetical protein GCM10007047_23620 [Cerasicoccus arenae]